MVTFCTSSGASSSINQLERGFDLHRFCRKVKNSFTESLLPHVWSGVYRFVKIELGSLKRRWLFQERFGTYKKKVIWCFIHSGMNSFSSIAAKRLTRSLPVIYYVEAPTFISHIGKICVKPLFRTTGKLTPKILCYVACYGPGRINHKRPI